MSGTDDATEPTGQSEPHPEPEPRRLGHSPVIPPRVGEHPGPIADALLDRIRSLPVTDLSDAVGRLYTASARLRPLGRRMPRVLGTALTVKAVPGDNWAIHGALRQAFPTSVLVVDWRGTSEACGAGVSALLPAIAKGLSGVVIDGAWRDIPEVESIGFPVIGVGVSPFSPTKAELGEINVPVACGDVVVHPGDLVVGDAEGVVFVPREHVERVVERVAVHHVLSSAEDAANDENQEDVFRIADAYWSRFDAEGGAR